MNKPALNVLCVVGTSSTYSATHTVIAEVAGQIGGLGGQVDVFEASKEPLALFNPESSFDLPDFGKLKARVERADAYVLATPDYHGSISSTLKNFLDHFWQEFTGKLVAPIVCSNDKGLTTIDQLRTVARQCYAWCLPYGVAFSASEDLKDGRVSSSALQRKIEMLAHDLTSYGRLLRDQRGSDLKGKAPSFLARLRPQSSMRKLASA